MEAVEIENEPLKLKLQDEGEQKSEPQQNLTISWSKLAVIFLCGRMGCGKSTAIESIVRNSAVNKVNDWVVAFTPTQYTGEFSYLPQNAIFEFGDGSTLLKMYLQVRSNSAVQEAVCGQGQESHFKSRPLHN